MKKLVLICIAGLLMSCEDVAKVRGKEYPFYGVFNESTQKNDSLLYEVSMNNTVWGILGAELCLIPPAVVIGWELYRPVKYKPGMEPKEKIED